MKRLRDLTAVLGMVALTACNNASIEGSWVEPVPGMPGMQQGFVLDGDGSASSINMATLKYEAWKKSRKTGCCFQVPASAITRIFPSRIR